jgi:tetratricopeptide (TPR) repeat protein
MSDSPPLRDRYLGLIDDIVQLTLKGKVRSKEQVYRRLTDEIESGTGEIFERCLGDRLTGMQQQAEAQTDEFKQAKAERSLRALRTIQGEWERWLQEKQADDVLHIAIQQLVEADAGDRLDAFTKLSDPNREQAVSLSQLGAIAKVLQSRTASGDESNAELQQIARGITQGIESWQRLENHLVSWIYDQNRSQLGFEGVPGQRGPWAVWAKEVNRPTLHDLFHTLALEQSVVEWAAQQDALDLTEWVEMSLVLRYVQQGLVNWFDKLIYDSKVGAKLSISTYLAFAVIWSQLASGFNRLNVNPGQRDRFANGCFQITLQILRLFAQQPYFPLYGGIFASFSGSYLRDALNYLDEPLRQAEGTQEKARILTLLGASTRALGQLEKSAIFHEEALEIAREAGDRPCEIANLNHLSRVAIAEADYSDAIRCSQEALILSRQVGDRNGEANALANLGYSEVVQHQELERLDPDIYEVAIDRLQDGLKLAERLGDRQSQALCLSSLGMSELALNRPEKAIAYLEGGIQSAQFSGDVSLQGLNLTHLAEAHNDLQNYSQVVYTASLGMYLLHQIGSGMWRQAAGLLVVLRGQLGVEAFEQLLSEGRSQIIRVIGVDGYDHLPTLLDEYQQ